MMLGDLNRSNRISSNFIEEIKFISHEYRKLIILNVLLIL